MLKSYRFVLYKSNTMKHLATFKPLVIAASLSYLLYSCAGTDMNKLAKEQKFNITPNPLELHGDSVILTIEALLPVKMLKKNKVYTATVTYKAFENKQSLGKIVFDGTDFPAANVEQPKITKKFSFGYDKVWKKGALYVMGEMADQNKIGKKTPEIEVCKGIITTPLLVKDVYPVSFAEHGYDNREKLSPTVVEFFFLKRSPKLDKKEISGNRGKFFEKFVASKYVTRTVNIVGTHSPEGFEAFNEKLSEQRAIAIEKYYREMMKKFNYGKKADSITFVVKGKVKDWSDFKVLLNSTLSGLNEADKSEILAIIDSEEGTFHQKELRLQKLKSYKKIEKVIYPKLRNARTEVLTVLEKKTDAQIFLIAKKIGDGTATKSDTLTKEELLYAATLTPLPEEKEMIYKAATKRDASYEAHNNLGALYLEQARKQEDKNLMMQLADKAIAQLEIAKNKKDGPEVYTNLAAAQLMKGNKSMAIEYNRKAMSLGGSPDVKKAMNGIQGVLDIKSGKYESATTNLNNAGDDAVVLYNKALALLLRKEYQTAKSAIEDALEANKEHALSYYIAAIIAAKLNDVESVKTNLKEAFKRDDSLKRIGLDDLEFMSIKDNPTFKEAFL